MSKWITNGFVPASRKKGLENTGSSRFVRIFWANEKYITPKIKSKANVK